MQASHPMPQLQIHDKVKKELFLGEKTIYVLIYQEWDA